MKLSNYINEKLIISNLSARTKVDVLAEMVKYVEKLYPSLQDKNVYELLVDREKLGTTGIGNGVAIPHTKLEGIDRVILLVARSIEGVDFESLDQNPVHIFFLLLAPEENLGEHLRILAYISRLLQDESFRKAFLEAQDKGELYMLLKGV
ncbi:PTS IIA-like nitrogen-regulatory protein PtsN [Desulfonauticus submarinus]|uniref:PTS IIA-like nitrogen-regulatory protein PtsN n=1 Tax=Desulfonauticus submarinus TaxID=206665 RepID=A0A1G9ZMF9_9BACT|nr:PTS sugar transporter subunit IIA [Desulfonauticus submarinus]SDN22569.1 PTS IIA-like nitrogen-regulatory protein PtsN [Desulfonauticus submarinus]